MVQACFFEITIALWMLLHPETQDCVSDLHDADVGRQHDGCAKHGHYRAFKKCVAGESSKDPAGGQRAATKSGDWQGGRADEDGQTQFGGDTIRPLLRYHCRNSCHHGRAKKENPENRAQRGGAEFGFAFGRHLRLVRRRAKPAALGTPARFRRARRKPVLALRTDFGGWIHVGSRPASRSLRNGAVYTELQRNNLGANSTRWRRHTGQE